MSGISAEDVRRLRQELWNDGTVTSAEAERLFELDRRAGGGDRDWSELFVEALTDYLVKAGDPPGRVSEESADWLIARLAAAGRPGSTNGLKLLEHLFERADCVPLKLKAFALDSIEQAVASATGPTRREPLEPGSVNPLEARLLRRFLFAPAGDGRAYVTRPEAEMLWRMKDRSLGKANAPEWMTLWVQALANHLLASPDNGHADHDSVRGAEAFLATPPSGLGEFLERMATARPDFAGAISAGGGGATGSARGRSATSEDELDAEERQWTEGKVCEDGEVDDFEQALLEFVVR